MCPDAQLLTALHKATISERRLGVLFHTALRQIDSWSEHATRHVLAIDAQNGNGLYEP
jgi:hypothetical protein